MVKEQSFNGSERGISPESDSNHAFALLFRRNYAELQSRIWIAQIRVLMAVIEKERQQFITKYSKDLHFCYDEILKNQGTWVDVNFNIGYDAEDDQVYLVNQFDEFIRDINDFEINHLYHLSRITRNDDEDDHLLYLPHKTYKRLEFLKDVRNALAHISCCPIDTIEILLGKIGIE